MCALSNVTKGEFSMLSALDFVFLKTKEVSSNISLSFLPWSDSAEGCRQNSKYPSSGDVVSFLGNVFRAAAPLRCKIDASVEGMYGMWITGFWWASLWIAPSRTAGRRDQKLKGKTEIVSRDGLWDPLWKVDLGWLD